MCLTTKNISDRGHCFHILKQPRYTWAKTQCGKSMKADLLRGNVGPWRTALLFASRSQYQLFKMFSEPHTAKSFHPNFSLFLRAIPPSSYLPQLLISPHRYFPRQRTCTFKTVLVSTTGGSQTNQCNNRQDGRGRKGTIGIQDWLTMWTKRASSWFGRCSIIANTRLPQTGLTANGLSLIFASSTHLHSFFAVLWIFPPLCLALTVFYNSLFSFLTLSTPFSSRKICSQALLVEFPFTEKPTYHMPGVMLSY